MQLSLYKIGPVTVGSEGGAMGKQVYGPFNLSTQARGLFYGRDFTLASGLGLVECVLPSMCLFAVWFGGFPSRQ